MFNPKRLIADERGLNVLLNRLLTPWDHSALRERWSFYLQSHWKCSSSTLCRQTQDSGKHAAQWSVSSRLAGWLFQKPPGTYLAAGEPGAPSLWPPVSKETLAYPLIGYLTISKSESNLNFNGLELEALLEFRNTTLMLKDIMEPSDAGWWLWNRYCHAKDPKMVISQVQL